jgi:hypothetical protein
MLRPFLFLLIALLTAACNKESIKFNNANLVSSCGNTFTLQDRTISGDPGESVLINIDDLTRPLVIQFRDRLTFNLVTTRNVPAGESRVKLPEVAGAYEMVVKNDCGDTGYSYATATKSTTSFTAESSKRLSALGNTIVNYAVASMVNTADLDNDGDQDLVYLLPDKDPAGGHVPLFEVYLNNGSGVFTKNATMSTFGSSYSTWFSLTDVTGDNRADLVFSIQDPIMGVCVRPWNPLSSRFDSELCTLHVSVAADPDSINKIQFHDFNNDGKVDIAMAVNEFDGISFYDGTLVIMLGRGDGMFTQIAGIDNLGAIHNFILADINNDGLVDVTVAAADVSTIMNYNVFLADSETGLIDQNVVVTYPSSTLFDDGLSTGIRAINVTDINDDRILDFVAINEDIMEQLLSGSGTYSSSFNSGMADQYAGNMFIADVDHVSQGEELFQGLKNNAEFYNYTGNFGGTLFLKENQYVQDLVWDSSNTILNDLSSDSLRYISTHMTDYNGDGHLDVLQVDAEVLQMIHFLKGSP